MESFHNRMDYPFLSQIFEQGTCDECANWRELAWVHLNEVSSWFSRNTEFESMDDELTIRGNIDPLWLDDKDWEDLEEVDLLPGAAFLLSLTADTEKDVIRLPVQLRRDGHPPVFLRSPQDVQKVEASLRKEVAEATRENLALLRAGQV